MRSIAMSGIAEESYTLQHQEGEPNAAVFRLKPLDGFEYMEVMTELVRTETGARFTGKGLGIAVKYGLVGWENFPSHDNPLPFNTGNIKKIHGIYLSELADKIINMSVPDEDTVKNS